MIDSAVPGESAFRFIKSFEHKYGEELLHLAFHAALPVVINADLINLLRINFFLDPPKLLPFTSEADLLLSSLCHDIGDGLYEMAPNIRNVLLQQLVKKYSQERVRDVAMLLWRYNERYAPWGDRPELERAQQLTVLNFLDPLKARQWLAEAEISVGPAPSVERDWFVAMWKEIERIPEISTTASQYNLLGRGMSELKLPNLGEGMHEVEVIEWFVKEGDSVKLDQMVVKVDTDKAIIEIPSPITGRVSEIRVKSGQTAKVGDVLVVFDASKEFKFGELLRQFRMRASMTQRALADKLGIHRRTISAWEYSNSLPKNRSIVVKLASALHLNEQETKRLLTQTLEDDFQTDSPPNISFSELVKQFRIRQGMTQQELAEELGVHPDTISNWERANYLPKNQSMTLRLAKALYLNQEETDALLSTSLFPTEMQTLSPQLANEQQKPLRRLTDAERRELADALLTAFSQARLEQMVSMKFNKKLFDISGENFAAKIHDLVQMAEGEGWIEQLVFAAYEFNPSNQMMREFYQKYMLGRAAEPHIQDIITIADKEPESLQQSNVEDSSSRKSLPPSNINQLEQESVKQKWPGSDEDSVIDEMLINPYSPHWSECRAFVNELVRARAMNLPVEVHEEIVQNTMLTIVRDLPNFRNQSRLRTWIFAIVRSQIINTYKKQIQVPTLAEDEYEDAEPKFVTSSTTEQIAIARQEWQEAVIALQEYIATHANQERNSKILQMVIFDGYSLDHTAKELGVSASVVGYVVRSAQKFVREKLGLTLPQFNSPDKSRITLGSKTKEQYLNEGVKLYSLGQYREALAAYEQALRLDPYFADAYFGKGNALYFLKRLEEALMAFEQAIHLNPRDAAFHNNKGSALYSLGRYREALEAYNQALRLDSHQVSAQRGSNLALRRLGRSH